MIKMIKKQNEQESGYGKSKFLINLKKLTDQMLEKYPDIKEEDLNYRVDGRIEWICKHGVGHTIEVPKQHEKSEAWWSHGCDGCCSKLKNAKN